MCRKEIVIFYFSASSDLLLFWYPEFLISWYADFLISWFSDFLSFFFSEDEDAYRTNI